MAIAIGITERGCVVAIQELRVLITELEQRIINQGKALAALREQRDKLLGTEKIVSDNEERFEAALEEIKTHLPFGDFRILYHATQCIRSVEDIVQGVI